MKTLYRTTITIPETTYRKTRIQAAYQNKSVSKFISDILMQVVAVEKTNGQNEPSSIPFGKYSLLKNKKRERAHRADIYEEHLQRKVSY